MEQEFQIIDKYFKPLTKGSKFAQDLADDVAKINLKPNQELVISKDLIVEDVHFLRSDGGYKIASKLLLSNLSDIASAGAEPICYMLGFSKNAALDEKFYKEFSAGLQDIQAKYKIHLIGGDTVKVTDKLFFSLTIFATCSKGKNLQRKNAKINDLIFVTENIGSSYLGRCLAYNQGDVKAKKFLKTLSKKTQEILIESYYFPKPSINFAKELTKNNLSKCAIDVSDGLLADLNHICRNSNVSAIIYQEKIPLFSKVDNDLFLDLISAGEDYQLLFTAKKEHQIAIDKIAKKLKIKATVIGHITKKNNDLITILNSKGNKINFIKYGYQH